MATNKKKIFVTEIDVATGTRPAQRAGRYRTRRISQHDFRRTDFEAMLKQHAPVHGVALGGTRFGEPELEASKDMKVVTRIGVGFDAVDVPALSRRKVPLMVAGHREFALGRRTGAVHDADARQARGGNAFDRQGRQVGSSGSACCRMIYSARPC